MDWLALVGLMLFARSMRIHYFMLFRIQRELSPEFNGIGLFAWHSSCGNAFNCWSRIAENTLGRRHALCLAKSGGWF
jgi:hypothetical protein